ncbi:metallophosphoesterase family protein [Neptunicoccus cionae]|uniref:metallophosphoesterase family protein n=1 Tax=Neptunicoccus cionae TaxID=2035344 RepID=UPI000C7864BD|nr:DNA repair exonuclease [Amylibacter cionae]PLS22385.1 DNA repair exonuclease [Amylibacter cionae]
MIRFLHSSDLHLGKPFGRFPEEVRGRLREARNGVIARLAATAREGGAGVILLAGDTFDAETPTPSLVRQTLNAIAQDTGLRWVMMPGNHDSLAASELWRVIAKDKPDNLTLVLESRPLELGEGAVLLPAPCTARNPGRDLTEAMGQATPEGSIRIGLGHGGIKDFSGGEKSISEDGSAAIIPPDRAERSGLAYLALGDWHGQIEVGKRTWFSGTPERDSFKHKMQASANLVTVQGSNALPDVKTVPTGVIQWLDLGLELMPDGDCVGQFHQGLPEVSLRRDVLTRLRAEGRIGLAEKTALVQAVAQVAPDFLWFDADLDRLRLTHDTSDLDSVDTAGALRMAAQSLAERSDDANLSAEDREVAENALSMLFTFASESP